MGLNNNFKFWNEIYEDYKLPEEKCKKNIRIGQHIK